MTATVIPRIVSDRLYGITLRPQELAIYGEKVSFSLRYSPIFDAPDEETSAHFKLLVLEVYADVAADDVLGQGRVRRLQLIKCGWEVELASPAPCRVGALQELPDEVPHLLARIADTVNDLARRAVLEAPLGPELVAELVERYRRQGSSDENGASHSQ